MICVSDGSPPVFGVSRCKAALFPGRPRVWASVPNEAIFSPSNPSMLMWFKMGCILLLRDWAHLHIQLTNPLPELQTWPAKRKERCCLFENCFFSSSEFCFETLLEKLGWDLASLYPAKLSKQRLQGLGFFPGSLDSCKLLELCSHCLSFHIRACFLCQLQLFRPQLPISASQIRTLPYLESEP